MDLCAEPFRKSSFHPPGRPFSQNPPHTHPDSTACMTMLPILRKLPAGVECRRYDICFSISFRLEASLIRFAGQISLTLRRTTDAVCSRTTVSGHRRFNGRGRPASSAEYRTCGRKAAAEKLPCKQNYQLTDNQQIMIQERPAVMFRKPMAGHS